MAVELMVAAPSPEGETLVTELGLARAVDGQADLHGERGHVARSSPARRRAAERPRVQWL
ncbi:MAG: hypothetical protein H6713_32760 [Myxococcales bacterium]|nr:hypothetical protein [Myxococcales bacterium]